MKNIVITGATSGVGKGLKELFLKNGDTVITISRSEQNEENHFSCDVSDANRVEEVFSEIGSKYEHIDILILNAGYGLYGATELIPDEQARKQFDVNVFGVLNCYRSALKYMSKGSKIFNISSACALFSLPYRSLYCASKAAVSSMSFGMRLELKNAGIDVVAICPGDIKTNFTKNREKNFETNEKYGKDVKNAFESVEKRNNKRMSESYACNKIYKICTRDKPKAQYIIGTKYKFFNIVKSLIPTTCFYNVINKIFNKKTKD